MANGSVATDNRFSKAFGTPSHRATGKVVNVMTEVVKEFIANSPFIMMATSSGDGACDASPRAASRASSIFSTTGTSSSRTWRGTGSSKAT